MLTIDYRPAFRKDYKRIKKRGYDVSLLKEVVSLLAQGVPLPPRYHDHALNDSKHYKNVRECHILPDWLLIYRVEKEHLTLILTRTGTHSDLF